MTAVIIVIIIFFILTIALAWTGLQIIRNHKISNMRIRWIYNNDPRRIKYSFSYMMKPSLRNWLGFRLPKDKHYLK